MRCSPSNPGESGRIFLNLIILLFLAVFCLALYLVRHPLLLSLAGLIFAGGSSADAQMLQVCPAQNPSGSDGLGRFSAPFEEPTVNGAV